MSFPEQPFGFVAGRWVRSIGDTPDDADRAPDYVPVETGTVVFTPQVTHRVAADGTGWAGIIKDRIPARLGERGQLIDAEGHDHLALAVGVYSVSYDFGSGRSWPSHYIEVRTEHTADSPLWLPPIAPPPEGLMIENRVITIPADGLDGQVLVWDGSGFSWDWPPSGPWDRGHVPADGTSWHDLPSGRWYVPTGAAATALGLPEVAHGSLLIHRHRGTDSHGLATFLTRTAPPRMWSYAWEADGGELSGWHLHDDNYVARSHLTGSETLSELATDRAYVVPTGSIATSLGLPEPVNGLLQVTRWGAGRTGAGVAVFTSREEPARMWSYSWQVDGTAMAGWLPMWDNTTVETTVPATRRPQWITTFQDGHGWTHPYNPGAPLTPDTTDYLIGTQSIRIDSGPGLYDIIRSPELNLDLRGKALVVLAKPHSGLSDGLRILAGDIAGGNYARWTMYRAESAVPLSRYGEWAQVRLVPETYVGNGPDWANTQQIQIGTSGTQNSTTSWSVQAVGVADTDQHWPQGVISLTFDDGEHDIMQAARQYMTPRNMAGVAYVAKDWANTPDFVSDDDIRELHHTHGWTIGAHGTSVYTGYSPEELRTEWSEEKAWLNTLGIDAQHLAYVGGQYTEETIKVVQEFFKTGRSISAGLETLPVGDPYRIRAVTGVTDSGTGGHDIDATKLWIDHAVREGAWLNLVFHRLVDVPESSSDISWTAFADLLDYIQASGAAVRTPDELSL